MKTLIIKSQNNNNYLVNNEGGFFLLHPNMQKILTKSDHKESSFEQSAVNKLRYWEQYNIISNSNQRRTFSSLQIETIQNAIINTPQIIFEVTDQCNMQCYYCGYGQLYDHYDPRKNQNMKFSLFLSMMKYMYSLWSSKVIHSNRRTVRISFYGGEPLLNIEFIQKAVDYLGSHKLKNKEFIFSMTTNGLLINKYLDFLVQHKFELLISIDGNEYNNSYRVTKSGLSVFKNIYENIVLIQTRYPEYFKKHVRFNAVLHNRNSMEQTTNFIYQNFGKIPSINELNISKVNPCMMDRFQEIFKSLSHDYNECEQSPIYSLIKLNSPQNIEFAKYLNSTPQKVFNHSLQDYISSLLYKKKKCITGLPTGTCIPFSRKIFLSVTGKIYPCERIGNEIEFGFVNINDVKIYFEKIVEKYNDLYSKYIKSCATCTRFNTCPVCIVSDINAYNICHNKYGNQFHKAFFASFFSVIENEPSLYIELINRLRIA